MSYAFDSRLGEQLYQLLPEVYRTRDNIRGQAEGRSSTQDLAGYLDAHGHLLDLIHATLEQQLKDALPESSQDWLLPYFAQLLAANIVSPDSEGKHAEIKNAVSWRQRKGTLKCVEEIAEAVGQLEVELQEGWKRVAMTPRIGMPLMPSRAWDNTLELDMSDPYQAIRHPGLPAAMVDLRRASRAVKADPANSAARTSNFKGENITWRQNNRHGVPCFLNSFDDVSRRIVDIRTPGLTNGHYHHKRLLAYMPPPAGFFPLDPLILDWTKRSDLKNRHLIEEVNENDVWVIRNKTERVLIIYNSTEGSLEDKVELVEGKDYRIENIHFSGTLLLRKGRLELHRVEANKVEVDTFSTDELVLTATDCLFNELSVGAGKARLDSCTVLGEAQLRFIDAVDCIFIDIKNTQISGVVKYSRIPPVQVDQFGNKHNQSDNRKDKTNISENPSLFGLRISYTDENLREHNGAGVLRPDCSRSIYEGASDGGEMGYFHNGRGSRPVRIAGDFTGDNGLLVPAKDGYSLKDLIFESSVEVASGPLVLNRSAAPSLTVNTEPPDDDKGDVVPSLKAKDCLFDNLTVAEGLASLEYSTVMKTVYCKHLQASDCIFVEEITGVEKQNANDELATFFNCLRYSRFPSSFLEGVEDKPDNDVDKNLARSLHLISKDGRVLLGTNTLGRPLFSEFYHCKDQIGGEEVEPRIANYGEPGYGVLDLITSDAIRFGAEDGGEMGAYHHKYYSLKAEAVLDKMREFLPVGIEPVLIQDTRLLLVPPEPSISEESTGNGGGL